MKKTIIRPKVKKWIINIVEILATLGIAIWTILWDEISLGKGLAILTTTISTFFIISQNITHASFEEEEEKRNCQHDQEMTKLLQISKSIEIEEMWKCIYELKNEEQKDIYIKAVETFTETMKSRIEGERSGALSRNAYYEQLQKAADTIIADKKAKKSSSYKGEIWAMTVWQDDELDFGDILERNWIDKMKSMDDMGIPTTRICIMKNKKSLLTRGTVDDEVEAFLDKMLYYCKTDRDCQNTTLLAVDSIDTLSNKEQRWINKGFFATKLDEGELRLIRGVSLDNANSTTLGGEIDFNKNRVAEVRNIWGNLKKSASMSLLRYLWLNASNSVKIAMEKKGFPQEND